MKQQKKKGSFKWKLVVLYAVLFVFVILAIGFSLLFNIRNNLYRSRLNELRYTAGRISDTMLLTDSTSSEEMVSAFAQVTSALLTEGGQEEGLMMFLLDENGALLYGRNDLLYEADLYSRSVLAAVNGQEPTQLYVHQVPGTVDMQTVGDYAMPVFQGDDLRFILFLRQSVADIEETLRQNAQIVIMVSIGALLLTAVLSYLISSGITRPILVLTQKAQEFATGQLENVEALPTDKAFSDEIEELENNFNQMARDLSRILSEANSERNKLAAIFQHMADGLAVYDINGRIIQCNLVAQELMGSSMETDDFETRFPRINFQELLYRPEGQIEQRMMHLDEHFIMVDFVAYRNEDQLPEGLIVVLQDVTNQHHAIEMQKEFVANVSHELRTPITTIKSYVETMLEGEGMDDEMRQSFLSTINQESDRMNGLIGELLELSRIDNRQLRLNLATMNACQLLTDCVQRYQILAEKKEQRMHMLPSEDAWISCDRARIEQVIRNVLMNAVNYSPRSADISAWVTTDELLREVQLHIRDTGMGIPYQEQKRIFERFYRIDKARSRSTGGTGLGLPIAKEMMEMHGGRITVDSVPGHGSTFHLIFPMANKTEAAEDEKRE